MLCEYYYLCLQYKYSTKNCTNHGKRTENCKMVFKDYYDSLPDDSKETMRNRILAESGMSYTTFYYKLRHNTFKPLEERLIDRIIEDIKQVMPC